MIDASVGYRVPDLEYVVPLSGVYFINTIISVSVASEDGGKDPLFGAYPLGSYQSTIVTIAVHKNNTPSIKARTSFLNCDIRPKVVDPSAYGGSLNCCVPLEANDIVRVHVTALMVDRYQTLLNSNQGKCTLQLVRLG